MNEHTRPPGARSPRSKSAAAKRMAAYRQRMHAAGYRQVTRWVLDTRRPEFVALAHEQARIVAASDDEAEIMNWLDQVRDWPTD